MVFGTDVYRTNVIYTRSLSGCKGTLHPMNVALPLCEAVQREDLEEVKRLLREGANINECDETDVSGEMSSFFLGSIEEMSSMSVR